MEPQIRAKLVLDTSELGKATGSGGGSAALPGKGNSDKLLSKLVKGQAPISGFAGKMLSVLMSGGAGFSSLIFGAGGVTALGSSIATPVVAAIAALGGGVLATQTFKEEGLEVNKRQGAEFGSYKSSIKKTGNDRLLELQKEYELALAEGRVEEASKILEEMKTVEKNTIALSDGIEKATDMLGITGGLFNDINDETGEDGILGFIKSIGTGGKGAAEEMTKMWDNFIGINDKLTTYEKSIPTKFTSSYKIESSGSGFDPFKVDQRKESVFTQPKITSVVKPREKIRASWLDRSGVN